MADPRVEWIPLLNELFRQQGIYKENEGYHWAKHDDAPFTPLTKPLSECRIGLTSGCGGRLKDQALWEKEERNDPSWRDDISWREIPKHVDVRNDVVYCAGAYSYDSKMDPNIILPLDRMRELEQEGFVKDFAPSVITHHATWKRGKLVKETAPVLLARFREMEVDAIVSLAL